MSFQVYFQCKRWKGSVGSKEIRDFRGALQGRADKGLFITTGILPAKLRTKPRATARLRLTSSTVTGSVNS
ncbi:restriction endonuclease [Hasllibacter sp. MH4015]|uniref:restriction endonuclease n=1 Tax=Hasllibacter sp. MH4015 TaxID=2854029 RepID=UPI00351D9360